MIYHRGQRLRFLGITGLARAAAAAEEYGRDVAIEGNTLIVLRDFETSKKQRAVPTWGAVFDGMTFGPSGRRDASRTGCMLGRRR